jgi:hypothetical protein
LPFRGWSVETQTVPAGVHDGTSTSRSRDAATADDGGVVEGGVLALVEPLEPVVGVPAETLPAVPGIVRPVLGAPVGAAEEVVAADPDVTPAAVEGVEDVAPAAVDGWDVGPGATTGLVALPF